MASAKVFGPLPRTILAICGLRPNRKFDNSSTSDTFEIAEETTKNLSM
jgi:hypothetical protein